MGDYMQEKLADLCHQQWSGWMKYLFSKCRFDNETGNMIIPKEYVDRWKKQINTPYRDLSEKEKDSDRREADKFLALFNEEVKF